MKKYLNLLHISLIITGIFFNFNVNAKMYKWVDEDGNTHYSQTPPSDNDSVEVIKPPPRVDTENASKTLDKQKELADKLREDRVAAEEEKQKAKEEEEEKQQKCEQAKKRLASYQRPRVNTKNPDGSVRDLSEEERQAEIVKSNESIKKFCE